MKTGNVIRDFTIIGSNYTLRVEVNGEDLQAVANALWDESRQAARTAAQIEAGLRPYPWDESVASAVEEATTDLTDDQRQRINEIIRRGRGI